MLNYYGLFQSFFISVHTVLMLLLKVTESTILYSFINYFIQLRESNNTIGSIFCEHIFVPRHDEHILFTAGDHSSRPFLLAGDWKIPHPIKYIAIA